MKLTKKLEAEIRKLYKAFWDSYINGDLKTYASLLDADFKFIGSTEAEPLLNKKDSIKFLEATAEQLRGKAEFRNRNIKVETADDLILITELCDGYILIGSEWNFYSRFRLSSLLKKKKEDWKFIHQHVSMPDSKAQEGESYGLEQIRTENIQLRDAVKRRTEELENKNRELEIEAALERVRARAMTMQSSDELIEVANVLRQQMVELGQSGFDTAAVHLYPEDSEYFDSWYSFRQGDPVTGKIVTGKTKFKNDECKLLREMVKAYHSKQNDYTLKASGEKLKEWFSLLTKTIPEIKINLDKNPGSNYIHFSDFSGGSLVIATFQPPAQDSMILQKRCASVFDLAYRRYVDLKKAEAQAREAKIEAALEKVRSRTMAMHKSDELAEVATVLFEQMSLLERTPDRFNIRIANESEGVFEFWATDQEGHLVNKFFRAAFDKSPVVLQMYTSWKAKEKILIQDLHGDQLSEWVHYIKDELGVPFDLKHLKEHRFLSSVFFSNGMIGITTNDPPNPETLQLIDRFAKVFDQTYTRFLDLQKAEAQAREAQIETGLERVRSKTMAMHKSEEVTGIAVSLNEELLKLGFEGGSTIIIIDKETGDTEQWTGFSEDKTLQSCYVPYFKHPSHDALLDAWKRGEKFFVYTLTGEEKKTFDEHYFATGYKHFPETDKKWMRQMGSVTFSYAFMKYGAIHWGPGHLTEEQLKILQRFAKVFEQSYTRFLDLQKAEVQVREAKIEAALERTRTQSMLMQHSKELDDSLRVFHEQVLLLGINSEFSYLWLPDEDKDRHIFWAAWAENIPTSQRGKNSSKVFKSKALNYPLDRNEPATKKCLVDWKSDEPVHSYYLPPGEVENYFDNWKELLDGVERLNPKYFPGGLNYVEAFMKYGCFGVMIESELSEEEKKILYRFAIEFERTYTRFLDLQKAEAQAREAQIEAALERVRSRSMAMHKSDDLHEVIKVVTEQLFVLDLKFNVANFAKIDPDGSWDLWLSTPEQAYPALIHVPYLDHPIFNRITEEEAKGNDFYTDVYTREETNIFFHHFFENTIAKNTPEERKQFVYSSKGFARSVFLTKNIWFSVARYDITAFTDEENAIFKRFANVFEQAYTRFLDLQKAEAQAREAQIEASLERVRSRAMAMQNSDELKELIGSVFTELTKLDIVLTRCLIMIYDPRSNDSVWWMANSEAPTEPIGLRIQNHGHPPYIAYLNAWQEKKLNWVYVLEGAVKKDWDSFLFVETELSHLPDFVIAGMKAPERVYLNSSFNSFGNLTLASLEPLSNEHFDILLRFAKVFDLTYTRFNDLKQAEAQARESQIQLALERVRARTMAMQKSNELTETSFLLFQQFKELGSVASQLSIGIINEQENVMEMSATIDGSKLDQAVNVSLNEPIVMKKLVDAWKEQKGSLIIDLSGDELKTYNDYRNSIGKVKFETKEGEHWVIHIAFFSKGMLSFSSHERHSHETVHLLERFAAVFDLTYTRFNDLKQAEAQTKEAKVEAALERVRAKAMAMHSSEDLTETIKVFYHQLQTLNLMPRRCGVGLIDKETHSTPVAELIGMVINEQGEVNEIAGKLKLSGHPVLESIYDGWLQQQDYHPVLRGNEIKEYYQLISSRISTQNYPDDAVQFGYFFFFPEGTVYAWSEKEFTEDELKIYRRFTSVLSLTYKRYNDLRQAEAQANEARIEIALERIRARALAMHKSDELFEVAKVMREQMALLGQPELEASVVHLYEQDPDHILSWRAFRPTDSHSKIGYGFMAIPKNTTEAVREWLTNFYSESKEYTIEMSGAKQDEWYDLMSKLAPDVVNSMRQEKSLHEKRYYRFSKFSGGALLMVSKQEPSVEVIYLQKRAAVVFDLAYRRFSDLQKAEAQAREAQIEASLERVRSKTMAMHNSQDVGETVVVMFDELRKLGIETLRCGVGIMQKNYQMELWTARPDATGKVEFIVGHIDMKLHPLLTGGYEAWKNKAEGFFYQLKDEDLKTYFDAINSHQAYPAKYDVSSLPSLMFHYEFNFNEGCLFAFSIKEFSDESSQIFKRFTGVFGQTYRRFLDLQKAEANAREAQIEAGLERVRAKAMAMHSSKDLAETLSVFYRELKSLSVVPIRCGVALMDKEPRMAELTTMNTTSEGDSIEIIGKISMTGHPVLDGVFESWLVQKEYHAVLRGNQIKEYYQVLKPQIDCLDYSHDEVQFGYYFMFNEGDVYAWTEKELTEDELTIYRRFTTVISLTYKRYKDLQQAEAQAREATIEAALERVRGKAMAMHSSKDLATTIGVFYHELEGLNLTPRRCGVGLIDKEKKTAQISTMNASADGQGVELVGNLDLRSHPVLTGVYNNWLTKTEYHPVLRGNEIKEYYQIVRPQIDFPDYPNDSVQYGYFFFFDEGGVYAWTEKELSDEELKIYRRFTSVLSLTYKRYKDLKDAEARAQTAIKDAALDRIRADIASMRTINDLDRITPLIWNELTVLGIPFIRCGVFIMDDDQQLIHTFLSTPDGKAIAAFHLPYDTPGNISKVIDGWRHRKIYLDHWGEEEFVQFADILMKQGALKSREQYLKTIPPGGFYLHFLPFLQGMLYVGNTTQLNNDEIELIQHVADAFSTAYARYEDFNKLEAAKQQVENTLTDLKQAQTQLVQSEKMASLGELTAGIAHEIQNPLNFVNNFSEVSKELLDEMKTELETGNTKDAKDIADNVIQNLEKINHHGKRADAIVKSMLQHSRSSSGKKEPADINGLADEYLRLAYHGLRAKDKSFNAKFETEFDSSIGKINIISQDIGRVLVNLINNAFYAVSERKKQESNGYEPTVTVYTKKTDDKIEIKVRDNGNGIPQKVLDKIFQPFFTTKPTGQGTGLGLSLAYDIITKGHGGELRVETREGEGSEFTIQIPMN